MVGRAAGGEAGGAFRPDGDRRSGALPRQPGEVVRRARRRVVVSRGLNRTYQRRVVMKNSRRAFVLVCAAAAVGLAGAAAGQPKAKYTMKIAHLEAPTQPRHLGLLKVGELVKARTNGEVEVQLFPASQLGNARQMVEGVQFGTIEATMMPAAFLGGFNPAVSVLDIPYLFPTDRAKSERLRESAFGQAILNSFNSRGLLALRLWPNGRKSITS